MIVRIVGAYVLGPADALLFQRFDKRALRYSARAAS